ncbi:hypothetical protein INS49_013972 [Diaporthe citri]|uniref:uncharacterized protein n=1 Tax=Diaporthe citri TaxID=83186 RepID=UPI001C8019CF|nr:uncharacterized protein INS49_013972 [Diaporthe citri]KAG6358088.1 hypothetical protein INS49_013972 [Diaporthe citri]
MSRGILGTLRNLQHKDLRRRWVVTSPSLDTSKMSSPCEAEVQESGQRSLLEDRSNMVMPESLRDRISKRLQARSLSSRYGDFTFDPSPRQRRRNGRYSSVCMSSAESTPLLNAPAPGQGQVIVDAKSQPNSWRSTIDPLATSSLMLATDQSSEVLGSGQSSACGEPPNSPAMKSLAPREKPSSRLSATSCASERSTLPMNPLPLGITMTSGNRISQSTTHGGRRQRMTSSRFSDVRTPENIIEASDEDVSPPTCTPGDLCVLPSRCPGSQPLKSSMTSPTEIAKYSCTAEMGPGLAFVPVDRVVEQTRSTQNDPSNCFWASTSGQNESMLNVYDNIPLNDGGQTQARKSPTRHLHTGALTPENTRGLWCTPRKSPSPPRRHAVWAPDTSTGHSNE